MIKPARLQRGDTVAIVSLSSGVGGEPSFKYRFETGKKRLETEFGLNVITMPNTLKGVEFLHKHPKARAADLMQAFQDSNVKAVLCMLGGDDTIRMLNYVDLDVIRSNPKIFMGYSDTTVNHFMMYKAGLVSFYGPCVLVQFAENVAMHEYTKRYITSVLFEPSPQLNIQPSPVWTSEFLEWSVEENNKIKRTMNDDEKGFELLQGRGTAKGRLMGGCVCVFSMMFGTSIWPDLKEWDDAILFLETSENQPQQHEVKYILRGLAAQGVIDRVSGIIFGKPMSEKYYDEYKNVLTQVIGNECARPDIPILYNMNFGHTCPICILPYGVMSEIDCENKTFRLLEPAVI